MPQRQIVQDARTGGTVRGRNGRRRSTAPQQQAGRHPRVNGNCYAVNGTVSRHPVPGSGWLGGATQEARAVRCCKGMRSSATGPFLEAGMTVRNTPVGGTLMGSRSRSSHRASRWLCSALAQQQQVAWFEMARQDSQYHALSSGITQRSASEEMIWRGIRVSLCLEVTTTS